MPFEDITLNDGRKIPSIAFGSGSVNKGTDIHLYIEQAIDTGFSHLDTAQYYYNESSVGKAIKDSGLSRDELWITSKWGLGPIGDVLENSLKQIGVDYLDLYLIHSPRSIEMSGGDYEGTWKQFVELREKGLVKSIGVSNFSIEHLEKISHGSTVKPAVNQIHLHPYLYSETAELLEYHAKHGIVTEAYGSLATITEFPGGPVDAALDAAAERLKITRAQVIFLWVKAKGAVIVTTSSKKSRLEEYIKVGDLPPLTPEEVAAIDEAGAKGPGTLRLTWSQSRSALLERSRNFGRVVVNEKRWQRLIAFSLLFVFVAVPTWELMRSRWYQRKNA